LEGLKFGGGLKNANSKQLDPFLDEAIETELSVQGWPFVSKPVFQRNGEVDLPGAAADLMFTIPLTQTRVVVEIEKSNKKTIWFDFIKLWMFLGSAQADAAVLIVPNLYAHSHGEWNLYENARNYLGLLGDVAQVSPDRIAAIAIIGYSQEVWLDGIWLPWDSVACRRIKSRWSGVKHGPLDEDGV
jgi:hypothetical protein